MIWLGTSSWSFSGWRGVFYPEKVAAGDMLPFYAARFPTVEVNTSFYALPEPATLLNWVESVPEGFRFALKVPRRISHEKRLVGCEAETLAYLDALQALGHAAAPGLLQLPPDFTRQREGRELATYLDWLATMRRGTEIAVEVRARDLMTEAFAHFLAERGFILVITDRIHTPDLRPIWDAEAAQVGTAFVRWIGDDKHGPQGDRELTAPQDEKLDRWAAQLRDWDDAGITVFGYMHNPYEGHAPESVRRLMSRLEGRIPPWPPGGTPDAEAAQLSLL
jgi:uncharacterized protein YecE (DUF72 family)